MPTLAILAVSALALAVLLWPVSQRKCECNRCKFD